MKITLRQLRSVVLPLMLVVAILVPFVALAQEGPGSTLSSVTGTALGLLGKGVSLLYEYSGLQFVFQLIFTAIGTLLVTLAGVLTVIAGAVFDAFLQWTVVDLGGTLTRLGIADGINLVWTAFRDIANILIIGIFVFIAISIILGVGRYGDKAMIARVLIVAVLINFSLLFTRIIVDSSNLVSGIFYRESLSAIGQRTSPGAGFSSPGGPQAAAASGGIATAFMGRAGLTSLWAWDIGGQLWGAGRANNSAFIVVAYSLAMTTFLLVASAIFLFGAFLMASRAIMLVFLTITSSLAFAAYLVPKMEDLGYGWKQWWEMLIKAALFGPLLTIFLWAALMLLRAPKGSPNLSAFIQNPGDQSGWVAIIMFIFVAGFLFVAIKAASMFASSISNFSMAAFAPAMGLFLGGRLLSAGARLGGGLAATKFGSWAGRREAAAGARLSGLIDGEGKRKPGTSMASYLRARLPQKMYGAASEVAEKARKKDFDVRHSMLGKEIAKVAALGAPPKPSGGFEAMEKRAAAGYAREGERAARADTLAGLTKEQQEDLKESVRQGIVSAPVGPEQQKLADDWRETTSRLTTSQNELARATTTQIEHMEKVGKSAKILRDVDERVRLIESGAVSVTPEEHKNALDARNSAAREHRANQNTLEAENSRIAQAQRAITQDTGVLKTIRERLDTMAREEGKLPEKFLTKQEAAEQAAFNYARSRVTNIIRDRVGAPLAAENDTIAKMSVNMIKTKAEEKQLGRIADIVRRMDSADSGARTPPPASSPSGRPPAGP